MFKALDVCEKFFRKLVSVFLVIVFSAMILLSAVQVIARFVFRASLPWTEEAVRAFMVYTVFIGTILVYDEHGHVAVTNLVDAVPKGVQRVMLFFCYLLEIAFCGLLFYGAMKYLPVLGSRTLNMFAVPLKWLYICAPVSAVCTLVFVLRDFVQEVVLGKELSDE